MRPRRVIRPKQKPCSACPNCYRENEPVGYLPDSDVLTFECACGEQWVTAGRVASAHADWLSRSHHARNWGDL